MPALIDPVKFQAGPWGNAPLKEWLFDPDTVVGIEEDWQDYNPTNGPYTFTQATAGSAAIDTTTPANQGGNLQRTKSPFLPAAGKSIWAEFVLTLTATTPPVTKAQLFVGLAASSTAIISAGAINVNNRIGWRILNGGNLTLQFDCDK